MYLNLDNGVAKTGGKCYNIFIECGRGSMVERDLAKVKTRVRFPSPAPISNPPLGAVFLFPGGRWQIKKAGCPAFFI